MNQLSEVGFQVPEHVRMYLRDLGYVLPLDPMDEHIREWDEWMAARGTFYDYKDTDGFGRVYEVHRRSLHPATRVCAEWASLLLNDKTSVVCENQICTEWLEDFFAKTGFIASAQATIQKAFGLGTGAWAVWLDLDRRDVQIRRYDARMVIPLSWDELGVYECAFVTRVFYQGRAVDQLQIHLRDLPVVDELGHSERFGAFAKCVKLSGLSGVNGREVSGWGGGFAIKRQSETKLEGNGKWYNPFANRNKSGRKKSARDESAWDGDDGFATRKMRKKSAAEVAHGRGSVKTYGGNASVVMEGDVGASRTYKIATVCFDERGNIIEADGVCGLVDTGSAFPTFALVKPALDNTRVDMSPFGQSVFADAIDAIQAVDLAFDAMMNEVDVSKMRIFLSDVMFDRERDGKRGVPIPFGKSDCTVFRKVMSTEDMVSEFAPALRTEAQVAAFRIALQMLGDLCGFGISYFDFDNSGYVKTATEVSSDNSALMRNIRRHEHALEGALVGIVHAVMACARNMGMDLPFEGDVHVSFDDSIITDTAAEKAQDLSELGRTLHPWEYRSKWYGEDEATARARCEGLGVSGAVGASTRE